MDQVINEGPAGQPNSDMKVQELKNSLPKPGLLGHYKSLFTKVGEKNILKGLTFQFYHFY